MTNTGIYLDGWVLYRALWMVLATKMVTNFRKEEEEEGKPVRKWIGMARTATQLILRQ